MKYKCSCGMDLSMIGRLFEIGNEINSCNSTLLIFVNYRVELTENEVRKKNVICNSSRSLKQN